MAAARELAEGRCDVAICWDGGRSALSLYHSDRTLSGHKTPCSQVASFRFLLRK